jgi:aminopeptidase N
MLSTTLFLLLLQQPAALPDPTLPGRGNPALDVQHYELHLQLEPARRYIKAEALLQLKSLVACQEMTLDFHPMLEILETSIDGQTCRWRQSDHKLTLELPKMVAPSQTVEVAVRYQGLLPQTPSQGDPVGLRHDGTNLVAYLEPDGAHHFFPCNDHPSDKATYDLFVSVPVGNLVGALGTLVAETAGPTKGYREFHWATQIPTATYLVALGAGPYRLIKREKGRIPVWDYCEEKDLEGITEALAEVPAMIEYFEGLFGPYPFEKYGHILTRDWVGGMEDQSLTVLGRREALAGDESLLSHELAHQWFGDWVSPKQWADIWLNEGWATYAELLWYEKSEPEATAAVLATWRRSTLRLAMRSHPHTLSHPNPKDLFSGALIYNKGGMVLALLDGYLGRPAFLKGARAYLKQFGAGNASTADFEQTMSKATGQDLRPFFAAWVERNTVPLMAWQLTTKPEHSGWRAQVVLNQDNGFHPMATALNLLGKNGEKMQLAVRFDQEEIKIEAHCSFKPVEVQFDPAAMVPWFPAEPSEKE